MTRAGSLRSSVRLGSKACRARRHALVVRQRALVASLVSRPVGLSQGVSRAGLGPMRHRTSLPFSASLATSSAEKVDMDTPLTRWFSPRLRGAAEVVSGQQAQNSVQTHWTVAQLVHTKVEKLTHTYCGACRERSAPGASRSWATDQGAGARAIRAALVCRQLQQVLQRLLHAFRFKGGHGVAWQRAVCCRTKGSSRAPSAATQLAASTGSQLSAFLLCCVSCEFSPSAPSHRPVFACGR